MELHGKRVLITGASRGIGRCLASTFAEAGAKVALVARTADALGSLAAELGGTAHPADLSDPAVVAGLIGRVEDDAGPVDVLVNNAGVGVIGSFLHLTDDDARWIFQVNALAPISLARQVVPRMLERGGGAIVNVSSLAGVATFPGLSLYASTKAALSQFTAGLRADLRGLPVRTTLVELGPIPTDMLDEVKHYRPTELSFRRGGRLQLLPNIPAEKVAAEVVAAVVSGRRHVRLPRRMVPMAGLTEAPRRITEILLTGVPHQADTTSRTR
ncbi:MAG TPA: SDR family NAD(P)-dependent oxidoreductase [Acidimicrobiales bacterium]|nr:SDR family NAD(P)-dependent oxidoreductase [Acidimicrobiales bacterium]